MVRLARGFIAALIVTCLLAMQVFAADAKPVVAVIATGGTIAGAGASATQTVGYKAAVFGVEALLAAVPDIAKVADIQAEQIFKIASENMTPDRWITLGKRVSEVLKDPAVSGVVITHGTDTLEETAYFLNLTLKTDKPVVLVGAMRPATAISADGPLNLYNGVCLAASPEAKGKGVMLMMNDMICPARETTKVNTQAVDTFRVPDLGYLGYMQQGTPVFNRTSTRKHTVTTEFDIDRLDRLPMVEIIYGYAGSHKKQVEGAVSAGAKGVVNAGVGDGSLSDDVKDALTKVRGKGVLVVRSSRTGSGIVARNGEADDDKLDFIASDNLTPQKARILLALAMTVTKDTTAIQKMFQTY